tara:strand:+ start:222 stop:629 length:408 start_codon:yes stop_codon:yes gene_type:complete
MSQSDIGKVVSAFTVYKFIKSFTTPYTSMPAYKLGIIDKKGNFIKKSTEFTTPEEKEAGSVFNRLIINLKKVTDQLPGGALKAKLQRFSTALLLIKEDVDRMGGDGELVINEIKEFLSEQNINLDEIIMEEEADV